MYSPRGSKFLRSGRNVKGGPSFLKGQAPRVRRGVPWQGRRAGRRPGRMAQQQGHSASKKRARHPGGKRVYDIIDLGEDPSLLEEATVTKDTTAAVGGGPPQEAPQGITWGTFSIWAGSLIIVAATILFLIWWLRRGSAQARVAEAKQREALAKASSVASMEPAPVGHAGQAPSTTWGDYSAARAQQQQRSSETAERGERNIWATPGAASSLKSRFSDI